MKQKDDASPGNDVSSRSKVRETCLEAFESVSGQMESTSFVESLTSALESVTEDPHEISSKSKVTFISDFFVTWKLTKKLLLETSKIGKWGRGTEDCYADIL